MLYLELKLSSINHLIFLYFVPLNIHNVTLVFVLLEKSFINIPFWCSLLAGFILKRSSNQIQQDKISLKELVNLLFLRWFIEPKINLSSLEGKKLLVKIKD